MMFMKMKLDIKSDWESAGKESNIQSSPWSSYYMVTSILLEKPGHFFNISDITAALNNGLLEAPWPTNASHNIFWENNLK